MIAALILAGGQGVRLGGVDKASLDLGGQTLLAHLLARLRKQARTIAISANGDLARFASLGLEVLPDGAYLGRGPLAGIAAGLAWAKAQQAESLVSIPVDTPFIPPDLIARLNPAPAVAIYRGRQHHLVAHWQISSRPALLSFLETAPPHRVRDFLRICGARQVDFAAAADPFLNINTAADLASAAARLAAGSDL